MRKGEIGSLVKGTKIQNKRSEEIVTVEEVNDKNIKASNGKTYAHSTLIRSFVVVVEEPVVEEPVVEEMLIDDIVDAIENGDTSVLVKPVVEVNPTVEIITGQPVAKPAKTAKPNAEYIARWFKDDLDSICNEFNLTTKQTIAYTALKLGNKNIMEVYVNRKGQVSVAIRESCLDNEPELKQELIVNNDAKFVGNGTFTLNWKFRIHSKTELVKAVQLALA